MSTVKARAKSVREIGKFGWTEGSRLHSTIKRLMSSIDEQFKTFNKKNKKKVVCPRCGKVFHNGSGKLPEHKSGHFRFLGEGKPMCEDTSIVKPATIVKQVQVITINGEMLTKGDKVLFCPYPFHNLFNVGSRDLIETTVEKIYLMSNDKYHIKFSCMENTVNIDIFKASKNFIKV